MRLIVIYFVLVSLYCSLSHAQSDNSSPPIIEYQVTEFHYQYGTHFQQAFSSAPAQSISTYTLQHASAWIYGETFFFADYTFPEQSANDLYTELYVIANISKFAKQATGAGLLRDVGVVVGVNYAKNPKVYKYLPGIRLSWNIPDFQFFNTDITAYLDDSRGVADGGAPTETNSYMLDISWSRQVNIGQYEFTVEGHVEYISRRRNAFGERVKGHFLAQPQIRYDAGRTLLNAEGIFFVGLEYQLWINKLGSSKNDNLVQALAVLRF